MANIRLTAAYAALLFSTFAVAPAQQSPTRTYSNDLAGLREQIADIVAAEDSNDTAQVQLLVRNMVLDDPSAWVKSNLGVDGHDLNSKYAAPSMTFQARFLGQLSHRAASAHSPVSVTPFAIPNTVPSSLRGSVDFTVATPYRIQFGTNIDKDSLVATFVYAQGALRFAGWGIFPIWVKHPQGLTAEGKNLSPPRAIYAPDPIYSQQAKQQHIQGTVAVACVVGTDGRPHDLKAVSGEAGLREAALQAVSKWQFEPAKMDGKPMETPITVQVNFRLY